MSIFILEDDIIQAERMRRLILEICDEQDVSYDFIEVTSKEERIVERLLHASRVPIYFLDIEIKGDGRKGLETARKIRQLDDQGIIVFVTTHFELAPISYSYMVSAFTFIDKGLPYEEQFLQLEQCLLHYKRRNESGQPSDDFIIDTEQATVRLPFREVEYIMTDGPHRLALIAANRVVHFYGTLKEVELLDRRLLRCHQSYVVNSERIASFHAKERELVMEDESRIPVSRRMTRQVREALKGKKPNVHL